MFFDIIAVLIITFFAALGMISLSEWLLKNPFKKSAKQKRFAVVDVDSIKEEDIEQTLSIILSEGVDGSIKFFLNLQGITPTAKEICKKLRRYYVFYVFEGEEEGFSLIKESLHES